MKRKLSLLVALTALITALSPVFPARAAFTDVAADNPYKEAITTLSKLKVINGYTDASGKPDGTFGPEKDITRAEFTKMIVYMLGYGDLKTKITQFDDVAEDHWANPNIKVAYDLGIVNGYDASTFKPDSPVTYEQALKMVVCTLGYQSFADQQGGYPQGYISQASSLQLTDGISGLSYSSNAPRGVVAQIMYNALETDKYEMKNDTWENSGKNLLNDYLNVYKMKGTIVGVEESTTADCQADLAPGTFAIDDDKTGEEYVIDYTEYTQSITQMTPYLGQTVQIFYREDESSGDKWLVEIDSETYTNTELTISSRDIDSYSDLTLKYYKNDGASRTTLKLDNEDLSVRYNGRAVTRDVTLGDSTYSPTDALSYWLDPDSEHFIYGTARFIDQGSTGKYNVVDIYDYETIVAYKAPSSTDYRITDKTVTGNFLTLDPDDYNYKYVIKKNDAEIEVTGIAANDVVNYAVSLDGDYYTVYSTAKSVKGTITNLNINTDDEKTITIDNTEYPISDRFLTYISSKEQKTLQTGSAITAYLDAFGTLEWGTITLSTKYYPYAYVIDAVSEADDYYLKMFAPSNTALTSFSSSTQYKVKTFKIADTASKLNGKKTSPEAIVNELSRTAEGANLDTSIPKADINLTDYCQLVRVSFNSAAEIEEIVTINSAAVEGSKNEDPSALVRYKQMDPNKKYYVTTTSVRESKTGSPLYSIKTTTPLFVIPKDRTKSDSYSLKSAVTTNSMSNEGSYYLDAFDLNESRYPGCLLVYNTSFKVGTAITYSTQYKLLADDIKEELDTNEDEIFKRLSVYNTATTISKVNISHEFEDEFSKLSKGDVFLYGTDGDKYADSLMLVQDYDQIKRVLSGDPITVEKEEPVYDEDGNPVTDEDGNEVTQIVTKTQTYNWNETQEQTEDNLYQKYIFDWRYPIKDGKEPNDYEKYYRTGGNITNISSRACMFNLVQTLPDDNLIYVTKNGFDENGKLDDSDYIEIRYNKSTTKILRYDSNEEEFTPYAEGTEKTLLTLQDLKQAQDYGQSCSKILVTYVTGVTSSSASPTARFIIIYE